MSFKQAQLLDVARQANVAKSTVAAALNPGGGGKNARVGEQTAVRIRKIAFELGYRPNSLASGLRGASTHSVAAVWQFVDPWCLDANIGNELLSCFQADGMATYQAEHPFKPEKLLAVLEDLRARRPDALIIRLRPDCMDNDQVRAVLGRFRAVVAVLPWQMHGIAIDQVVHDRDSAIRQVVDHFAACGRKRVCIMLNTGDVTDRQKHEVFCDQCRLRGLEIHDRLLIDLHDHDYLPAGRVERYIGAIDRDFPGPVDVDAILCVNDVGVMAVAKALRDRRVRIGEDVALVGLNDPPGLALWDPPLASIDRNHSELLRVMHDMVKRRLEKPASPPALQSVHMKMVWRESAGGERQMSHETEPL